MWQHFKGAKKYSDRPLTPAEEKHRYELWRRWAAQGKKLTPGHWNMASACVRAYSAYPRDTKWSQKLTGYRKLKWSRIVLTRRGVDWFDTETGKQKFAFGFYDPAVASHKAGELAKYKREQKQREAKGEKLKHYIPNE